MVNNWLMEQLAPCHCELCQLPSGRPLALCQACQSELPGNPSRCQQCSIPLPENTGRCGQCLLSPPAYQHSCAPWLYTPPINEFLWRFKFGAEMQMLPLLTELLAADAERELRQFGAPDFLVPAPLHWRRQWWRGFNQAGLLAWSLARHPRLRCWELPVAQRLCKKLRATAAQQQLDRRRRQRNLRQAFTCNADLEGKFVVVIDDVMTTGATVHHLAQVLRKAGARRVHVWCVARTPGPCNTPDPGPY